MAWIHYKKIYDIIPQILVKECLKMSRTSNKLNHDSYGKLAGERQTIHIDSQDIGMTYGTEKCASKKKKKKEKREIAGKIELSNQECHS